MLRFAFFLTVAFASVAPGSDVRGRLERDVTWSGDVAVSEDVDVPTGITLRVENATVRFEKGVQLRVAGNIRAINSTFTSALDAPAAGDWKGIHVEPAALAFAPVVQTGSSVRGCTIRYAHTAVQVAGRGLAGPIEVVGCTIEKCRWGGVVIEGCDKAVIEKNRIADVCLDGSSDQGRPIALLECTGATVAENLVRDSSDCGIYLLRCHKAEVRGNKVDHIVGGPGPGPGGAYKDWGFGVLLYDSDDNRVVSNDLTNIAYISICLAYGSDDNVIEGNNCGYALDSINQVGDGRGNVCRDNAVTGGWSMLYVTGSGPIHYEKCNADSGGGYCFTVRTGQAEFVDCTWNKTSGMNIWGSGKVLVDHCRLRDAQQHSVSLQNEAHGTLIDCEFDKSAMKATPDATGRIDVQYRLTLQVVDADSGKPIGSARVTARPVQEKSDPVMAQSDATGSAIVPLTEFVFTSKGKTQIAPWNVRIEGEGYAASEWIEAMNEPVTKKVLMKRSH